MQGKSKKKGKPELCRKCRNPGCPKCGTTHGMWECIAPERNNKIGGIDGEKMQNVRTD